MNKLYFLTFLLFGSFIYGQNINDLIVNTANSQIEINLSKIPDGDESLFGFNSRNDFRNCKTGNPIKVLTIDQDNKLIEINEWRVPILLNDESKVLFTVQKINDNFEIADIGGTALANEIQSTERKNSPVDYLIRLYNLQIDFVARGSSSDQYSDLKITPLESAKNFLNSINYPNPSSILTIDDLLQINKIKAE